MKAAEIRQQLVGVGAGTRARTRVLQPVLRKYTLAKKLNATFTGDPDSAVLLDDFFAATDEHMQMLTEIVAHTNAWKLGIIDEMVPSGIWSVVGARAARMAPSGAWAVATAIATKVPEPAPVVDVWEKLAAEQGPLSTTDIALLRGWLRAWPTDASTVPASRKALYRWLALLEKG